MENRQDVSAAEGIKASPRLGTKFCRPTGIFGGLSGKLLLLTVVFVMFAEVLIFVPSVANMRLRWLQNRLSTAAAAAIVIDGLQPVELPRSLQRETLMATGTRAIILRKDGTSRLLAAAEMPSSVDDQYDLADVSMLASIRDALDTILRRRSHYPRLRPGRRRHDRRRVVKAPTQGCAALYSRNVFLMSLLLSFVTATLIFFAINRIMIRLDTQAD